MALKDVLDRLKGTKRPGGTRTSGSRKRRSSEETVQIPRPNLPQPNAPAPAPLPSAGESTAPIPSAPAQPVPAAPPPAPAAPPPAPAAPPAAPVAEPPRQSFDPGATIIAQVPTASAMVGVLACIEGELMGALFALKAGDNVLGRSPACDVQLNDPRISSEHAKVVMDSDVMVIMPLKDYNPVLVDDQPVDEVSQLADGDKVRLGGSTFRFRTIEGS